MKGDKKYKESPLTGRIWNLGYVGSNHASSVHTDFKSDDRGGHVPLKISLVSYQFIHVFLAIHPLARGSLII